MDPAYTNQEIMDFLINNSSQENMLSVREIAEKLRCSDTDVIAKALYKMNKRGVVVRQKINGKYHYCAKISVKRVDEVNADLTPVDKALKAEFEVVKIDHALEQLEQQIKTPTPVIENIDIKVKTLTRLAALLDDSISDVLIDVMEDLKQVNA